MNKTIPKLTDDNKYEEQELTRVVVYFTRLANRPVPLEYVYGCYEIFYPFFQYKEQAEHAFEEIIHTAISEGVSLGHMTCVAIGMIDSFKERRGL